MNDISAPANPSSDAERPFLLHLALSAISVAQPFYSVTGKGLNFFVAWRMSGVEFASLVLLIYLGPPVITYLVVALGNRVSNQLGRMLSFLVFWLYISLACLIAAQQIARNLLPVPGNGVILAAGPLLLILSAMLTALLLAKPKVRGFVRFFSVITFVLPAMMLLRGHELGVIQFFRPPPAEKIKAENPPNIILIIYDELPLTTVLNADGLIDGKKFPAFHEFARGATWFESARSLSGYTETAVPSILAGRVRTDETPATYKNYPSNIFATLGPSYNVLDLQIITDLDPARQPGDKGKPPQSGERFARIAADVGIIYAHIAAPPQLTAGLPPINTQHNRFGEDVLKSERGVRHHDKFIAALARAKQPFLAVYHNIYPHNSWSHYPSGRSYAVSRWGDYISLADRKDPALSDDNARIMHDYQAHFLQSMHADKLFGELIAHLKENGQYDHSLIAVVADHGVSLWPGEQPRSPNPERWLDVAAVPLIIKLPEQSDARVSLDWVLTRDIYPTILDYLGVAKPADVQGKSLLDSIRHALPAEAVASTSNRNDPTLKRRMEWFGTGTSSADLYGFGRFRGYIGHNVNEFEITARPEAVVHIFRAEADLRNAQPLSARIDAQIKGGAQDGRARDILVALGDRICGAAQTTDLETSGRADSFTLILAEDCLDLQDRKATAIRAFVVGSSGHLAELTVDSGLPRTSRDMIGRLVGQLAEFTGNIAKAEPGAHGHVNLPELQKLGVTVPSLFVREDRLASPWGNVTLASDGHHWILDLYSAPKDVCVAVHLAAGGFPGVARIAASATASDELNVPVTAEQADRACSNAASDVIRIITGTASDNRPSAAALPASDLVLEKLADLTGGLAKVPDDAQRPVDLRTLHELGVAVPDMFVQQGMLAWPWGQASIIQNGHEWILDLHSAPKDVCKAVHLGASKIPGAIRIATSNLSKDETIIPVTIEQAEAACANDNSNFIRIIVTRARSR